MTNTAPAAWSACPKCDGAGRIRGFDHVANGVCFRCEGAGGWNVAPAAAARKARRVAAARAGTAARDAARATAWAAFTADHPAVAADLEGRMADEKARLGLHAGMAPAHELRFHVESGVATDRVLAWHANLA